MLRQQHVHLAGLVAAGLHLTLARIPIVNDALAGSLPCFSRTTQQRCPVAALTNLQQQSCTVVTYLPTLHLRFAPGIAALAA